MTDKKLKVNSAAYTELSIQIATLEAKVDKLLELAIKNNKDVNIHYTITGAPGGAGGITPPRFPNESYTDYMKRIGQYNVAQSTDESFSEEFK